MSLLSPTILPLSLACPPGGCTLEPVPTAAAAAYPEPLAAPHACVEEDRKKDEPALRCAALPPQSTHVVSAGARVAAPAGGGVSEVASIARPPRSFRCAQAGCQRGKWRPQAHASPAAGRAAGAAGCAARLTLTYAPDGYTAALSRCGSLLSLLEVDSAP